MQKQLKDNGLLLATVSCMAVNTVALIVYGVANVIKVVFGIFKK